MASSIDICEVKPRFHGLDVIRFASFIAIAMFHIALLQWYSPGIDVSERLYVIKFIEIYARTLAFSGFTVVFLTSLLIAYSSATMVNRMRLFGFLTVGWVIFSITISPYYDSFLAWDVYPLIFAGIFSASVVERWGVQAVSGLGFIGLTITFIPFWEFSSVVPIEDAFLQNMLGFADCTFDVAEWPLLPWIGLVWGGFACGALLKKSVAEGTWQTLSLAKGEASLWVVLLLASLPSLGAYFQINLGRYFSCEAYRQPPLVFWSNFLWPLFLIRLATLPSVEQYLRRQRVVRFISSLTVSKRFWLAYLLHYLVAHAIVLVIAPFTDTSNPYHDAIIVFCALIYLPLTELLCRMTAWLLRVLHSQLSKR